MFRAIKTGPPFLLVIQSLQLVASESLLDWAVFENSKCPKACNLDEKQNALTAISVGNISSASHPSRVSSSAYS